MLEAHTSAALQPGVCPVNDTPLPDAPITDVALTTDTDIDIYAEAVDFLTGPDAPAQVDLNARLAQVREEIERTGAYRQTYPEISQGTALAWRNHARCIGRLHWRALNVLDHRDATTAGDVFDACVEHLRYATNGGDIRSTISLFAPQRPGGEQVRIWNSQLVRYAGYRMSNGSCIGDPMNVDLTEQILKLGWQGAGGQFDVLPLVIQVPGEDPQVFQLPPEAVLEVPITHDLYPWFADLGLRWHALPAISDMRLELAGLTYTACPFNGWYVGFEIGSRNFADEQRYNLLPLIAERMGLDTRTSKSLWKDRALIELNQAVIHSFTQADVRLVDHHVASRQFCTHQDRETQAGRVTPTDWAWVVPPLSGSVTPTFHRTFENPDLRPNFYHQPPGWLS